MPAATRIVGLGASAGGLAALEQFLGHVPPHSHMAYVVVQHLDPTQKALLPELLQRSTAMRVREVVQDMRIEPDCVYVIPPNTELSVADGTLKLRQPSEPRGLRLPINVLFSSLASARGADAIAVVLSGMGSDGTLGLQAVKALGGLTVVQEPGSAQFAAMPRSAIAAGCADIVAPPAELPARILAYIRRMASPDVAVADDREGSEDAAAAAPLQQVLTLLQRHTRHDFSLYKPSTLHRRIERRMAIHGLATLAHYAAFLQHNPQEIDLLFRELLIGVTSFFRDSEVWETLATVCLPNLLRSRGPEQALRVWSVGCSTGEEAYSLAIAFSEAAQRLQPSRELKLQIFASDLSPDAIATARRGHYPLTISADVSPERLSHYFNQHETYFQIDKAIRDMVLFAQHDVVLDPPFTRLDLVACRNLLIYFDRSLQRRLLPLFHYSLRAGGLLLLGSSESVGRFNHLFTPVYPKLRIYARHGDAAPGGPDMLLKSFPPLTRVTQERPMPPPDSPLPPSDSLQSAADQVLLQVFAPAAVLLNAGGDIVYISGRTGKYLEPAAGKANWNFHAMIRDGLRKPLADALSQAAAQQAPVHLHGLQVNLPGNVQLVDVTVQTLHEPAVLRGMTIVVFRDSALLPSVRRRRRAKGPQADAHAAEIQQYRDEIQSLREETRASGEELQSINEELQSTNEELQSTNEELTTSKEEMQSMNEELQTINAELQTKLDDLALAQSDMKNLLNSIDIGILFLDQNLNVRRYTDRMSTIVNLRESDIGRPLSDLSTTLQYPTLHDDALETLSTLRFSEKQIATDDERWFSVRIMPYRRLDNRLDGIVITFVDITKTKELEAALRENQ